VALRERRDADGLEVEAVPGTVSNGERLRVAQPAADAADLQRANAELQRHSADLERANERLERANAELWRENARLAHARLGQSDAAAAAQLLRSERDLRPQLGEAEATIDRLERLLATPRHQAVERARDRVMRSRVLYWLVRRAWALAPKR
jgi:predicted RNase H-like nuclease (RuvC/YqgF family)